MGDQGLTRPGRCVIVTAGPMGEYGPLRGLLRPGDSFYCADGGVRHLRGLGAEPSLLIGDFDSAHELPQGVETLRFPSEKDETDTMLAAMEGLSRGFREFLLLGGLRGRLDHTLANLGVLLYLTRHGAQARMADADNEALCVENGELRVPARKGWYISAFPIGGDAHGVTERGMKYSLDEATLRAEFPNGVSNEFLEGDAIIRVERGALLIVLSREESGPLAG